MNKLHLSARVPNEGARRLAAHLVARGDLDGARFCAAAGWDRDKLDRLLSGQLLPGGFDAHLAWLHSEGAVSRLDWRSEAEGGWFDAPAPRERMAA